MIIGPPDDKGLVVVNGRVEKVSDLWRTDPAVVEAAKAKFGIDRFWLDACAMPGTAFAPTWLGHGHGGEFVDALTTPWNAKTVWVNPPYSSGNLLAFAYAALRQFGPMYVDDRWIEPDGTQSGSLHTRAGDYAPACERIVFLGKLDPSTRWFKVLAKSPRCHETAMLSPRVAFIDPITGRPISGNNFCSVLFDLRRTTPKRKTYSLLEWKR